MAKLLSQAQQRREERNKEIISIYLELKESGTINDKAILEAASKTNVTWRTAFEVLKSTNNYQYQPRKNK